MAFFYYVPTITSEKNVPTPTERIISKTSFHVDIFESTMKDGNELIGTASVVLSTTGGSEYLLDYIRVVTKYETTIPGGSSVYHHITWEKLKAEHDKIVEACKELKEVWG